MSSLATTPAQSPAQVQPPAPATVAQPTATSSVVRDAVSQASQAILASVAPASAAALSDTNSKQVTKSEPDRSLVVRNNAATQAAENAVRLARGASVGADGTLNPSDAGDTDDLQQIAGVGPILATQLQSLGVTGIGDIAKWTGDDVARISSKLAINGRINREDWIGQAQALIAKRAVEMEGKA